MAKKTARRSTAKTAKDPVSELLKLDVSIVDIRERFGDEVADLCHQCLCAGLAVGKELTERGAHVGAMWTTIGGAHGSHAIQEGLNATIKAAKEKAGGA